MIQEVFKPEIFRFLGQGLLTTLYIAVMAILLSFVFGTLLGIARYSKQAILGRLAAVYIECGSKHSYASFYFGISVYDYVKTD